MPIYEYKCDKCGKFEKLQRMSDAPLTTCPQCGGPVKKLISHNVGIIFKGPGFYCTDNRSAEYKEKSREDKAADT
ncbi:MAG TPA: zinc ribbon domain-containing protein [Firmicutes bacterium]|nr:zinc ribbon domain-containing protein [Bacillota bacterium]